MESMGTTATEAAKMIGCSVATVSRWARSLQLGRKYGSSFMLTPREIKEISKARRLSPGRPKENSPESR